MNGICVGDAGGVMGRVMGKDFTRNPSGSLGGSPWRCCETDGWVVTVGSPYLALTLYI